MGRRTVSESPEVRVRALGSGGGGVADLPDGRVVFIQRTAPGDLVRIQIEKSKPRWATGSVEALLEPGPDRIEASCPLYSECGGCQLQHIPYERQIEWKGRFIADALGRIGGLEGIEPPEVVPSPSKERYRSRVTYTLRRLRGGRVVAGFHALGKPAHVIEVGRECLLPLDELTNVWEALREHWGPGARHLPEAGRLRLTLRLGDDGVELVVQGGARGWTGRALVERVPAIVAVWHEAAGTEKGPSLVLGTPGARGGTSFEQVNRDAAVALRDYVLEVVGAPSHLLAEEGAAKDESAVELVDAYCGNGTYGRALASRGWSVVGIELDPSAVELAEDDAPEGFSVVRGSVEMLLPDTLPADVLLVNPPRGGFDASVPPLILNNPPERIVYVSCDAGTLSRDLRALESRYKVESVKAFDLFPQTAHVETLVALRRVEEGA